MIPNTRADDIAAMQAKLQRDGVRFNRAMSVDRRELRGAKDDDRAYQQLLKRLLKAQQHDKP